MTQPAGPITKHELVAWVESLSEEDQRMARALATFARSEGIRLATPRDVLDMD